MATITRYERDRLEIYSNLQEVEQVTFTQSQTNNLLKIRMPSGNLLSLSPRDRLRFIAWVNRESDPYPEINLGDTVYRTRDKHGYVVEQERGTVLAVDGKAVFVKRNNGTHVIWDADELETVF